MSVIPPIIVPPGYVKNPLVDDLLCDTFELKNASVAEATSLKTDTISLVPGSLLTSIQVNDNIRMANNKSVEFSGDIYLKHTGAGTVVKVDAVPPGVQTQVLGYNTSTDEITYFPAPSGGGTITALANGANIAVDNTNPAVPIVSLRAPLTSALDVGTQDITTSVANADIDFTTNGTGTVHITKDTAGTALRVLNTVSGTVGSVSATPASIELYKNRGTAPAVPPVAGDSLGQISAFGKDTTDNKREYTRITASIRDPTAGVTRDGSLEFACATNNAITTYIQLNGNDAPAGEVNILKPLDLGQGSTGLIKTSVAGGNINITSDAAGYVALNSASGQVQLNGGNSVVAKGVNGVLLQTGAGTDRMKILPTAVELVNVPFDTKGQRIKSTAGSLLVGDYTLNLDTRVSGSDVYLTAGENDINYRFLGCSGLTGDVYIYRRTNITDTTGAGQPAVFEVVNSPSRHLQISGMPIAPSGFLDNVSLGGSAGQVITATGFNTWSWQTPAGIPTWFSSAPSSPAGALDMNANHLSNVSNFSWGLASGTTEYLGTPQAAPSGSPVGSIPITIGGTTYYIPFYS